MITKLGIASAFNIIFIAHTDIFPVLYATTAFGICNFVAKIFTSASPVIAQYEQPLPTIILFGLSLIGAWVVWGIIEQKPKQIQKDF